MHYFKLNIGDYAKKAGRLSMLQHGSYTLLMQSCYDREQFPTLEEAIEWTWASTTEEIEAVTFVLRKFFVLENGVYVQKRIQEEIAEYHAKSEQNKRIALERETKRKENSTKRAPVVNGSSGSDNEAPPNHEPRTINQEPLTNKPLVRNTSAIAPPVGISQSVWTDFVQLRKDKKAKLTQTAIDGIEAESVKAGWPLEDALRECCARGWTGFKAEWVADKPNRTMNRQEALESRNREVANRWAGAI
jgi:uncharacterized protein YdaU (DUF1376 family)